MGIFRRTPLKILGLSLYGLILIGCTQINSNAPRRLSPEWWDIRQARQERHELPNIYIVFNDHQLAWVYNDGVRFTNSEFKEYIHGLAFVQGCKKIRFRYGINVHRERIIRYAVIYY